MTRETSDPSIKKKNNLKVLSCLLFAIYHIVKTTQIDFEQAAPNSFSLFIETADFVVLRVENTCCVLDLLDI